MKVAISQAQSVTPFWSTAVAVPLMTCVPRNKTFVRRLSGISGGSTPTDFSTGKLSPASAASSTNRLFDSSSRLSPGINVPARSSTTSPGTTSGNGNSTGTPSRSTLVLVSIIASSRATEFAALRSCQKPSRPLASKISKVIQAFVASSSRYRQHRRHCQQQDDRVFELSQQNRHIRPPLPPQPCRSIPSEPLGRRATAQPCGRGLQSRQQLGSLTTSQS